MSRFLAYIGPLLAITMIVVACDSLHTPREPTESTDTLRRGNGGSPGTLDPALAEDVHAFNILIDLYEGLTTTSATGDVAPGVAESWQISDDGLEYIFNLRSSARWSNGEMVSATDFVRALRRVASPALASSYGFLLEPIQNFDEIKAGELPADTLGVQAPDPYTLILKLRAPTPYMLSVLAMPTAFPIHADTEESANFSRAENFIGNGAYTLADVTPEGPVILKRNELYWDAESVSFAEVRYFPIADPTTELSMYKSGELDITNTIPGAEMKRIRSSAPGEAHISPSLAFYYLAFDLTEKPFDDIALRESLSMAIDRDVLVELIGRGEQPAYSIVPPGVANHEGARYEWHDQEPAAREAQARRRYAAAGYGPTNPLSMKLTYDVGDIHERIALAVSSMWQDVLGVNVELEKKEWKFFLDTRDDRSAWEVMRFSWFGDYNDPMTFAEIFHSDSSQNLPKYSDAEYDELIDRAAEETNLDSRIGLMTRAEETILEDYPIVPLYFYVSKHLVKPHVEGFTNNILDRHPSKHLYPDR